MKILNYLLIMSLSSVGCMVQADVFEPTQLQMQTTPIISLPASLILMALGVLGIITTRRRLIQR